MGGHAGSEHASATRPRMRPTFEVELPPHAGDVLGLVAAWIRMPGTAVVGWVQAGQAELYLEADQRFFTPVLHVVAAEVNGKRILQGRFAPLPQVWMVFVGVYFLLAMGGVAATIGGLSQLMLGRAPWAFAGVPVAAALAAFVYGAAFIGQGLSADQMYRLRAFLDRAIDDAARMPRVAKPA